MGLLDDFILLEMAMGLSDDFTLLDHESVTIKESSRFQILK